MLVVLEGRFESKERHRVVPLLEYYLVLVFLNKFTKCKWFSILARLSIWKLPGFWKVALVVEWEYQRGWFKLLELAIHDDASRRDKPWRFEFHFTRKSALVCFGLTSVRAIARVCRKLQLLSAHSFMRFYCFSGIFHEEEILMNILSNVFQKKQ